MGNPIQIILNPENYEESRETAGGGPRKDFFANRDREFRQHKARLIKQLKTLAHGLANQPHTDLGYVKVILRRTALAKSHRPFRTLFKPERTPIAGGTDLGVILVEARPPALLQVAEEIAGTEDNTRFRQIQGMQVPYPSTRRSESGAIERIEIYSESDRRDFSLEEAVAWLSNPITGGSYEVELFKTLPAQSDRDSLSESHRRLFTSFTAGLDSLGEGLKVRRLPAHARSQPLLSVRVSRTASAQTHLLDPPPQADRHRTAAAFDPSRERNHRLLTFLDGHPLVRKISLPGIITRTTAFQGRVRPVTAVVPPRKKAGTYPKIGIIDGGMGSVLSDWVIDRWGLLAEEHKNLAHGSFIGGLAVLGRTLNGPRCCPESDGAELVDLAVFPSEGTDAFASYYPQG